MSKQNYKQIMLIVWEWRDCYHFSYQKEPHPSPQYQLKAIEYIQNSVLLDWENHDLPLIEGAPTRNPAKVWISYEVEGNPNQKAVGINLYNSPETAHLLEKLITELSNSSDTEILLFLHEGSGYNALDVEKYKQFSNIKQVFITSGTRDNLYYTVCEWGILSPKGGIHKNYALTDHNEIRMSSFHSLWKHYTST